MDRFISIVINAYNAQAALERQVANWSDYAPDALARVEFVVVDDGSTAPLTLTLASLADSSAPLAA